MSNASLQTGKRSRWAAIVNPSAGHGRCGKKASRSLDLLDEAGLEVDRLVTERPGHATELVSRAIRNGIRNVIALGGDGTANEVVNGITGSAHPEEITLATLPLGTGNSFLADFDMQDIGAAIDRLLAGTAPPTDLLRCTLHVDGVPTERWVLNNIIVGFGADVGALMNRRLKPLGEMGYSIGVLLELARLRPPRMRISIDGRTHERPFTMINVGNSQYTGGNMRISPLSQVDDGFFDLLLAERMTRLQLIRVFPRIFRGTHLKNERITTEKGTSLSVETDRPLPVLIDGDIAGTTPISVELVPRALRVVR